MSDPTAIAVFIIGSVIGGLSGLAALLKVLIDALVARPKIAEAYEAMATKQAMQISELRTKVTELELQLQAWRVYTGSLIRGIKVLNKQLVDAQVTPCWEPEMMDEEMK